MTNSNPIDAIAAITPSSVQPAETPAQVPTWLLDRACNALRDLMRELDRIADDGPRALHSISDAQSIARAAVSDSVRELLPALIQAQADAAAPVA